MGFFRFVSFRRLRRCKVVRPLPQAGLSFPPSTAGKAASVRAAIGADLPIQRTDCNPAAELVHHELQQVLAGKATVRGGLVNMLLSEGLGQQARAGKATVSGGLGQHATIRGARATGPGRKGYCERGARVTCYCQRG